MSRRFAWMSSAWLFMIALCVMVLSVGAAAVSITSFTPTNGNAGDVVTITGTAFTGATAVKFNGTTSTTYTVVNDTSITANLPDGATTGKITITTPDGTATSADDFTVWIPSTLDITVDPGYGYNAEFARISLNYSLIGPETYTGTVSFDNTGKATIGSIRPGSYTLSLFASHWLRRTILGVDLSVPKSLAVSLANGDADGDNQVNLFDFVVLDANFGSANAMADLDGNGMVNLFDYVIIDSFFGAKGDGDGKLKVNPIDGAEMVWVSSGEFLRGSNNEYTNEGPQRPIYLDGYWMYKYEVTVAQYRAFCQATSRSMPNAPSWGWIDTHPMVMVSWQDAADYASWAGVALPTEAQWEKAARGTDGREYPWGNVWDASKCANKDTSPNGVKPVGSYPSGISTYGCMDMAGNVWEWCADWYDGDYYQTAPDRNPLGPASSPLEYRVLRGGSWDNSNISRLRCAYRNNRGPASRSNNYGFRCARTE